MSLCGICRRRQPPGNVRLNYSALLGNRLGYPWAHCKPRSISLGSCPTSSQLGHRQRTHNNITADWGKLSLHHSWSNNNWSCRIQAQKENNYYVFFMIIPKLNRKMNPAAFIDINGQSITLVNLWLEKHIFSFNKPHTHISYKRTFSEKSPCLPRPSALFPLPEVPTPPHSVRSSLCIYTCVLLMDTVAN